ncbi:MAG: RNA polymerase-binding protein DksA [Burkholderiales bacterium PBB3]|nr:MAG: RNA polymerase-binding protein DksA [Burkholderiales bacterium PBB3]
MIVSLLQLMGFPKREPVHSRAEESPADKPSRARSGSSVSAEHAQASPARRQEVKSKSGKAIVTKAVTPAATPTSKLATKPAPKVTAGKALAKPAKPTEKSAASKPPKPTVKVVVKPSAKVADKLATKAVPKVVQKPAAKSAPAAPSKPVPKPVAKAAAKAQPIPAPKSAVKSAAKPVSMPSVVSPSPAKSKVAPAPVAPAPVAAPAKAGRPSSRLAQVTVPSMAQAVASTAAKSSYSQSTPATLIAPMLPSAVKKDAKLVNNWKTTPPEQLTDAELIAMPDTEYMNDVQMAAFKARLSKLKTEILASAGETTEHLREDSSVTPDPADRATIEEEHALELRTRDRERKLLKKIEQSIGRIDAGDYGYCDETGEPIGVGRLLARPTATLSLEAQQRRELKQKMFGD